MYKYMDRGWISKENRKLFTPELPEHILVVVWMDL